MKAIITIGGLCGLLFFGVGCRGPSWGVGTDVSPIPRVASIAISADYYAYPGEAIAASVVDEAFGNGWRRVRYERPLNVPASIDAQQWQRSSALQGRLTDLDKHLATTLRLDVYLPQDLAASDRRPVILVSPILGGAMIVDGFAEYYAKQGFVSVLVDRPLPHHAVDLPMTQVEDYLRLNVVRLRQAVDVVERLSYVDAGKIGAFGVSYGGIIHMTAAAVEPRIQYHVVALAAGNLPRVMVESKDGGLKGRMDELRVHNTWTIEETRERLAGVVRSDPIRLAAQLEPDRISMYVARFDQVVGTQNSVALWQAAGCPKLRVIPLGHYSSILVTPIMKRQSLLDFRHAFAEK